ncbi:MAG: hypothetical protein ACXW6V_25255, partial [Candidatus Binatia bacterium]
PTEHENGWHSQNMIPSIRHSRARGNPGLFCAELAWIPAFAGMTEPRSLFVVHIIPAHVFSKEDTKSTKFGRKFEPQRAQQNLNPNAEAQHGAPFVYSNLRVLRASVVKNLLL